MTRFRFAIAFMTFLVFPCAVSATPYDLEKFNKLPTIIRKHATDVRASCDEIRKLSRQNPAGSLISGIYEVDLDGTGNIAFVVDDLELCGGVYMGANCGNRAGCHLLVFQRNKSGAYEPSLKVEKYGGYVTFDVSTKRLWMLVLEIHASDPPCQPSHVESIGRFDHCHVMAAYKDGQWRWLRVKDLAGVISAIGTNHDLRRH